MRFKLVDEAKKQFPIHRLCHVLGVSESGYYTGKKRGPGRRQLDDMVLLAQIRSQFSLSHVTYGSPRMHVELYEEGLNVGRHRVARRTVIMAALLLQTFSIRTYRVMVQIRNWGVDISYVWTHEWWLCLAIVLDLYSRRIVGWETSDRLKKNLAITALKRAIATRQPPPGLIHHSDRGSQYCSHDYPKLLDTHGMRSSMSGKGNC